MSTCTPQEIEEKKRQALEKLKARKQQQTGGVAVGSSAPNVSPRTPTLSKPATSFYKMNSPGSPAQNPKANAAQKFLQAIHQNKMNTNRYKGSNSTHPYSPNKFNSSLKLSGSPTSNSPRKLAPIFVKTVTCVCYMVTGKRFVVKPSEFHTQLVETLKSIPSNSYDKGSNLWSFDVKDYDLVQERVGLLTPNVTIGSIPQKVLKLCQAEEPHLDFSCLSALEPKLANKLLEFQKDGVCFGIRKRGRVMIADEMGLGKTYQALAIADFYRDDWPLLICTSATTKESWVTHIKNLLPRVSLSNICSLNSKTDYVSDSLIVVTSYAMMERNANKLLEKNFGILIMDESQTLKNQKAKCTNVADRLSRIARRVILLSGTPALSRPVELFSQLQMLDRSFFSFMDYTKRYCDGKQTNYGWDSTGQSNLEELNVVLRKKFMIRRLKADVLPQLAAKNRETIILDSTLISKVDENGEPISQFADSYAQSKGRDKEEVLFKFFNSTATAKIKAVCAYLKTLLDEEEKFVVFAYHQTMIDAICNFLEKHKVDHIRIDGATRNDIRSAFIHRFQTNKKCQVAVLAIKACNAGITLTAAQLIIFAELDWNPSTLAQAESRCHRIGQQGSVTCRYLLAPTTADDIIWQIVRGKQEVLNKAGIFSENIQDGEAILGPVTYNKIDDYLTKKDNVVENASKVYDKKPENMDTEVLDTFFEEVMDFGLDQTEIDIDIPDKQVKQNKENELQCLLNDDDDDDLANLDF